MAVDKNSHTPVLLMLIRWLFKIGTPIMPGAMSALALKMWTTPQHFPAPKRELGLMRSAKAGFININQFKVRTWSWGEGPTVLFIHGWGGRGTQAATFVNDLNTAGFRVMSIDLPAHGETVGKLTRFQDQIETLQAVFNQIDNLHSVITHSFGGLLFYLSYHPQLSMKNLVLICPPVGIRTAVDHFSQKLLKLSPATSELAMQKINQSFGSYKMEEISFLNKDRQIVHPTMVVHDVDDDVVPFADGKRVADVITDCTFLERHGLGHRKILYDKDTISRIVEFISR